MIERAVVVVVTALTLASACDPEATLVVLLPADVSASDVVLRASLFAPVDAAGVTCDGIAFGDVAPEALFGSRLFEIELAGPAGVVGAVPREGTKLVTVDGVDANGTRAVAGCAPIPPHDPRELTSEIVVSMVHTVDASFTVPSALLEVELPSTGAARVIDALTGAVLGGIDVELSDAGGAAVVDGAVRPMLVDAVGALTVLDVVDVTGGAVTLPPPPAPARGGAFAFALRARFARGPDPAPLPGLAFHANSAVTVAGLAGADAVVVGPAAFAEGGAAAGAFIFDAADGALTRTATIAAVRAGTAGAAPVVDVVERNYRALGAGLGGGGGEDERGGLLGIVRDGDGRGRALLLADDEAAPCTVGIGRDPCLVSFAPGANEERAPVIDTLLAPAVSAGGCGDGDGDVAMLVERRNNALTLALFDGAAGTLSSTTPETTAGQAVPLLGLRLESSVCARDVADGSARRFLRVTFSGGPLTAGTIVDLGAAARPGSTTVDARELALPPGAAVAVDDATGELLLPFARGNAGFEINRYAVDGDGLVFVSTLLVVDDAPAAFATGSFSGAGRRELAVLTVSNDVTRPARLLLLSLENAVGVVGARTFTCDDATVCRLFAADVDDDAIDELLIASTFGGAKRADVMRFAP